MSSDGQAFEIRLANALWVQDGEPLLDTFQSKLSAVFTLDGNVVDFAGRPEETCHLVNEWTALRTAGRIHGLLRPADVSSRTRLLLTSALYLRARGCRHVPGGYRGQVVPCPPRSKRSTCR